jgi:hypothetical protein
MRLGAILTMTLTTQGCLVYSAASTAVSVTGSVLETGVDVVGGTVDLVIPGDDDD